MELYDVTDEFMDARTKRSKKTDAVRTAHSVSDDSASAVRSDVFRNASKRKPFFSVKKIAVLASAVLCIFFLLVAVFLLYAGSFRNIENVQPLSDNQKSVLNGILDSMYPEKRISILKKLPYTLSPVELAVRAGSAILVDAANGCVLYEKNADEVIPPASLTKLFVMYIVLKDTEAGIVSLDDIVPIPEKSWAINMPRDASLMFLGQGHVVTLRELMNGLAVASGNDAALAVANYISGSTDAFVQRMNDEAAGLGLKETHFVEPSGYDEHNTTTAREFAAFCCEYINRFPQSMEQFHSVPSIQYPLEKNLPPWQKENGNSFAVYQRNTNPLLEKMEGCDGIKTGFIYESGYNFALTARRNGTRFISVTLRGTGVGSKQGNEGRVHDGTELMEWAFAHFADFIPSGHIPEFYTVPSVGAKNAGGKHIRLVPAWNNVITVPCISGENAVSDAEKVQAVVTAPSFIYGGVQAGQVYGTIQYVLGNTVIETVPLVADRTEEKAGLFGRFIGTLVGWLL